MKDHQHLCMTLQLKSIHRAEVEYLNLNKTSNTKFSHSYTILFEVSPSDGIFESRLLFNDKTQETQFQGEILRINLYGQSSACIQDKYALRSFCYCKSYHKKTHSGFFHRKL